MMNKTETSMSNMSLHGGFCIAVALLLHTATAQADEQQALNGPFWGTLSESQRDLFMMGLLQGRDVGRWDVRFKLVAEADKRPPSGVSDDVMDDWARNFVRRDRQEDITDGIPRAQIVSGVTKIYSDLQNEGIAVVRLIDVAVESIRGASKEQIDQHLTDLRGHVMPLDSGR
jgi:hypothetical protein